MLWPAPLSCFGIVPIQSLAHTRRWNMASKRELARWRLLYELLLKGGTDHETICRIWPKLTLVPLEDAEYALAEWDDIRPAVRVLQTGNLPDGVIGAEKYIQDAAGNRIDTRADLRAIPHTAGAPSQPEDGEAKVSVTVGLLSGEDTLQSDFPSGWDGRESDAELMAAQKSYVARWTYLQYYRVKPKHM